MYTTSKRCTAHVTLKQGRVKEYGNRTVYLKDQQEFEIELYNPHQKSVLAKISINGIAISGGGIVLRPAQRVFLERYLDDNRKFKFDTYSVENSKEAAEAIALNGGIKVEFYYEREPAYITGGLLINPTYYNTPYHYGTYTNTGGSIQGSIQGSTQGINLSGLGITTNTTNTSIAGNLNLFSAEFSNASANISAARSVAPLMETGRIEKGNISSQKLTTTYEEFNSWSSESEYIKVIPFSQKPHEISELRQYCTSCSARIKKSSWKFCPACGATLED